MISVYAGIGTAFICFCLNLAFGKFYNWRKDHWQEQRRCQHMVVRQAPLKKKALFGKGWRVCVECGAKLQGGDLHPATIINGKVSP